MWYNYGEKKIAMVEVEPYEILSLMYPLFKTSKLDTV